MSGRQLGAKLWCLAWSAHAQLATAQGRLMQSVVILVAGTCLDARQSDFEMNHQAKDLAENDQQ